VTIIRKIACCPECGALLFKARSVPDLRRFFAVLRKTYDNWPHAVDFQPDSEDHLRGYLLVQAGHRHVEFLPYPEGCDNQAVKALFRMAVEAAFAAMDRRRSHAELRVSQSGVEVITPRSIAFEALTQKEWGPIRESVEAVIERVLSVPIEILLTSKAA
jgi:hypothetical protein